MYPLPSLCKSNSLYLIIISMLGDDNEVNTRSIITHLLLLSTTTSIDCLFYCFLQISFAALGWNTIISPAGYRANFCAGNCLFPPEGTFTSHALYQSLANLHSEGAIPPPCCVPRPGTYKNLIVAINETSGFVIRTYKHMIATECICM